MGEVRPTLMNKAARPLVHAPVLTRNFSQGMKLNAACSAPTSRLHPTT